MAGNFIRPVPVVQNMWWLALYLYVAPLVLSVILILYSGHLLGDFSLLDLAPNPERLLIAAVAYLTPLVVIGMVLKLWSGSKDQFFDQNYGNFLCGVLWCSALITLVFGSIPVGAAPAEGIVGLVQSVVLKFNPYLTAILLAAQRISPWKMVVGASSLLVMTQSQNSLLGYLVIAIALSMYWVSNYSISRRQLLLLFVIPIALIPSLEGLVSHAYDLRNQGRGGAIAIPEDLVIGYALGRINSLSSLYQILYADCCGVEPDFFYAFLTFIQRLTGLSIFNSYSPTLTYNQFILGADVDYAIFTSTAGAALIILRNSFLMLMFTVVCVLAMLKLMYWLTPIPEGPIKLPVFLLVIYFPYLSGDMWELSLFFQTLVVLRLTHWVLRQFGGIIQNAR